MVKTRRQTQFTSQRTKKKPRSQNTATNSEYAALQANNSKWCQAQCKEWNLEIEGSNKQAVPSHTVSAAEEEDPPDYDISQCTESLDQEELISNEYHLRQSLSQLIRCDEYKRRRLAEERQWNSILNGMFVAYMTVHTKTSQWGDPETWNKDWNAPCSCTRVREKWVDTVDILGEIILRSQLSA